VKTFKKLAPSLCLAVLLSLSLGGCSETWQGMKNDWHDVTSSNDQGSNPAVAQRDAAPQVVPSTTPAYN
jgi:hypothetical protein